MKLYVTALFDRHVRNWGYSGIVYQKHIFKRAAIIEWSK